MKNSQSMKTSHQGTFILHSLILRMINKQYCSQQNDNDHWISKQNRLQLQCHFSSHSQSIQSNLLSLNFQKNIQRLMDQYQSLRDYYKSGEAIKNLSDRQSLRHHCEYIRESAYSSWIYYRKHVWNQQFQSQDQSGKRSTLSEKIHQYFESHNKLKLFASSLILMAITLKLRRSSFFFSKSNQEKSFPQGLRDKIIVKDQQIQGPYDHYKSSRMDDKQYYQMVNFINGLIASCYIMSMFKHLFFQTREKQVNDTCSEQREIEAAMDDKK
ncbi:hypothetical protein FGO68_gene2588 [Halteria grandinella]|uniref:Transmembrane protein n=1 Tax=Halteria grandinella TaxID=5974 RepID=A0A8J8NLY4_HALGN|nr:hypothetical protein FGO68_gene2588 [Halteria grandinella]